MYLHFLTLTLNNVTVIELTHTLVSLQRDDRQTFPKDTHSWSKIQHNHLQEVPSNT